MTKFDETKIFKRPKQFPRICPNSIDLLVHYNTLHFTSVLFNMVINLICHDVTVSRSLFADDVNLWFFDESRPRVVSQMNRALGAMHSNADMLLLRFAVQKCKVLWFFGDEHDPGPDDDASGVDESKDAQSTLIHMGGVPLSIERNLRFLGVYFDQKLSFAYHIDQLMTKCNQRMWMIKQYCKYFSRRDVLEMYHLWIRSLLDYACVVYNMAAERDLTKIDSFQRKCLRVLLHSGQLCSGTTIEVETGFCPLDIRRQQLGSAYAIKRLSLDSGVAIRECIQQARTRITSVRRNDMSCMTKVFYMMTDSRYPLRCDATTFADDAEVRH